MTSEKPTEGPWVQGVSKKGLTCVWLAGEREPIGQMGHDETWIDCNTEANARLIAEAGTVHHEVGLSPRELLDGYRNLQTAISDYLERQDDLDGREYHGIHAESYDKLMSRRHHARDYLDDVLAKHKEV